ncbi:MAG: hypothetical protein K2P85_05695, partial [Flavobacteriaceae bacterium]|nr:hypothetical protein [Flavobacteriaceae bacterium]
MNKIPVLEYIKKMNEGSLTKDTATSMKYPTAISKRERPESDSIKINKVAQEVVAVSVVAVLDHMIAHINTPSLQA